MDSNNKRKGFIDDAEEEEEEEDDECEYVNENYISQAISDGSNTPSNFFKSHDPAQFGVDAAMSPKRRFRKSFNEPKTSFTDTETQRNFSKTLPNLSSGLQRDIFAKEEHSIDAYPIDRVPEHELGLCLIISNNKFKYAATRSGTEVDVKNLQSLFLEIGFLVEIVRDVTKSQMICQLKNVYQVIKKEHCAFVLCILSHGRLMKVLGTDEGEVDIWTDIINNITGNRCPLLNNKPKLILIQSCQTNESVPTDAFGFDAAGPQHGLHVNMRPEVADILLVQATPPNFLALRHATMGSPIVDIFCKNVKQFYQSWHLIDILIKIKDEATRCEFSLNTSSGQQIAKLQPTVTDTLRKRFYLSEKALHRSRKNNSNKLMVNETHLITQLPAFITAIACDEENRINLALNAHYNVKSHQYITLKVFRRMKSSFRWNESVINVAHGLEKILIKVNVEDIVNGKALLTAFVQLSEGFLLLVNLETERVEFSSPFWIRGLLHVDQNAMQVWAPHLSDKVFRCYDLKDLSELESWHHTLLTKPWQITIKQQHIAAANHGGDTIFIFNKKVRQLLTQISISEPIFFTFLSSKIDTLFVLQRCDDISTWTINGNRLEKAAFENYRFIKNINKVITRLSKTGQCESLEKDVEPLNYICEYSPQDDTSVIYSIEIPLLFIRLRDHNTHWCTFDSHHNLRSVLYNNLNQKDVDTFNPEINQRTCKIT